MLKQIFSALCPGYCWEARGIPPCVHGDWEQGWPHTPLPVSPSSLIHLLYRMAAYKENSLVPLLALLPIMRFPVHVSVLPSVIPKLSGLGEQKWPWWYEWVPNPGGMFCALGPIATLCSQSPTKSLMKSLLSPSGLG